MMTETPKRTIDVDFPVAYKQLFNRKWRHIIYYGGRGGLKSHSIARALLIRGEQEKLRILCTRELQRSIKDSVHKLLSDLIAEYELSNYLILKETIINTDTGTEFIFRGIRNNTTEIKSTEGVDICWCEEAHAMTEASIDILTPTIRKPGSQIIWSFNRMTDLDPVYVKFVMNKKDNTYARQINYDVAEKLGWFPQVLQEEMEQDKETPALFAHKWLGEPLGQAEMAIISRTAILEAMQREVEAEGELVVGVDVARLGNDRIVFWKRKGLKTVASKVFGKARIPQICDQLEKFVNFDKENTTIKVDDTGVGGGVTDEMKKRGYKVIAINFGGKPNDADKYPNWISEAWFYLADIMPEISLGDLNPDLLLELSTRHWKMDTKERRQVESKQDYKKRGFRSPDIADAVVICYAPAKIEPTRIIF